SPPSIRPSSTSTSAAPRRDRFAAPVASAADHVPYSFHARASWHGAGVSKRRVVVTGLGLVSPVGSTVPSAWDATPSGTSGIGPITRFDVSAFPVRFGGEVRGFELEKYITPKEARRMDPFMHYGVAAGMQAVADSGLDFNKTDPHRWGAVCGAGIGGLWTIESEYGEYLKANHNPRKISPFFVPASIVNMIAGHLSIKYNLKGPNLR